MKIISKIILLCLLVVSEHYGQHCGTIDMPTPRVYLPQDGQVPSGFNGRFQPVEIRLKIHIVRRSDGTGGLSMADVMSGVERANTSYSQLANIGFKICGEVDFIDDDNLYNNHVDDHVQDNIFTPRQVDYAIDVFYAPITNPASDPFIASWATFPWMTGNRIVMHYLHATRNTLAHEIGHYLGLKHTHEHTDLLHNGIPNDHNANLVEYVDGRNCSTRGDGICDTPADPMLGGRVTSDGNGNNCTYVGTQTDLTGAAYVPDVLNIMSYTNDDCRSSLSNQQVTRAQHMLQVHRPDEWAARNQPCPCENPDETWIYDEASHLAACTGRIWWFAPIEQVAFIRANDQVTIYNEVKSTADVTVRAGQKIRLEPGFKVALGAEFKVENQSCTASCNSGLRTVNNAVRELPNSQNSATLNTNTTTILAEAPTKLACFPNPANTSLNIRFQAAAGDEAYLNLVTIQGQTVLQLKESNLSEGKQVYQLSTTDLPAGVYFLNLTTKQGTETARVVIQH